MMRPVYKHILFSLLFFVTGWFYIAVFKSLLVGKVDPSTVQRIYDFGGYGFFIVQLMYSRKLLYGQQPKYKIVMGSVVLAYALIWITIFLLKNKFTGIVMH